MAIRDRIRRALRKSDSSDTISQTGSNTTAVTSTTAATSETSSLHKLPTTASTLSRIFTFGSRDKDSDGHSSSGSKSKEKACRKERKKAKGSKSSMHPSQRPLTLQNLKHQEMLSHFTMTFGATDPDQVETLSFRGVSPCCTRAGSLDLGGDYFGARSPPHLPAPRP